MKVYVVGYTGWTNDMKVFSNKNAAKDYASILKTKYNIVSPGLGSGIEYVYLREEYVN